MAEQTFWDRVTEALADMGVRTGQQTKLAEMAKIKQPSVAEWANGDTTPSLKNCTKIALKLNVCVEWLYTGRGPKRPGMPTDSYADQLWQRWPHLTEAAKLEIIGMAVVSASEAGKKKPRKSA